MDCKKSQNLKSCTCTYPGCPRRGICCECIKYHRENNELPGCFFSLISKQAEKNYDRSIESFVKNWKGSYT